MRAQAGYTTILKIIQIMTEKGLVEKDSSQRPQVYKPRLSWKKTQQMLLTDLMEKAFSGSAKELVLGAFQRKRFRKKNSMKLNGFSTKSKKENN